MLGTSELDFYAKQRFGIKGCWMQKPPKNTKIRGLLFSGRLTQEAINKAVINDANIILVFDPYHDVDMKQLDSIYVYILHFECWITRAMGDCVLSKIFGVGLRIYREQNCIWIRHEKAELRSILSRFRELLVLTGKTDVQTKSMLLCFEIVDLDMCKADLVLSTSIDSKMINQAGSKDITLVHIPMDLLLNEICRQLIQILKFSFSTSMSEIAYIPTMIFLPRLQSVMDSR